MKIARRFILCQLLNSILSLILIMCGTQFSTAEEIPLKLRFQKETSEKSGRFHTLHKSENWQPSETAIIVCDVWDFHHCLNAVRRLEQFGPVLNQVLNSAREKGVTIIHSPSDCMPSYKNHAARKRALAMPKVDLPDDIKSWCSKIPSEESAVYPIDQSDGGEDDDPNEHDRWAKKLKEMGRNPGMPWKAQNAMIKIDSQRDFVCDEGDIVWSILQKRKIKNVILTGVHTNMCVLGRPFGLRQMARNGKNVVLMRDMTDTMYNPKRWPYVSHFSGTDFVISHIEKFVCPTITSDQLIGGKPFRFKKDTRPHLAIVMAEDEYKTNKTLPKFAKQFLGKDFQVSFVFGNDLIRNDIPGLEVLEQADIALFSIRRRVLPSKQMHFVKKFVADRKPVIGIRTASHSFSLRGKPVPKGFVDWPEFDAQVFGGNYSNHYGNKLASLISITKDQTGSEFLNFVSKSNFKQGGSLYVTSPLAKGTTVLLKGAVEGKKPEPVAWTFKRADGGKSFYTSLGHFKDFKNPQFQQLMVNALKLLTGLKPMAISSRLADFKDHWSLIDVAKSWEEADARLAGFDGTAFYRCVLRVDAKNYEKATANKAAIQIAFATFDDSAECWVNGSRLLKTKSSISANPVFEVPLKVLHKDDANLVVVKIVDSSGKGGLRTAPEVTLLDSKRKLAGKWQFKLGTDGSNSNIPLPAKFGGSPDIYYELNW